MPIDITYIFQIFNRVDSIEQLLLPFLINKEELSTELLIYDDGSTDGTREKIKQLMVRFPNKNTHYFETDDLFETEITYDGCNRALGKLICLIQDDDYYETQWFIIDAKRILENNIILMGLSCKHGVFIDSNMFVKRMIGKYNSSNIALDKPEYTNEVQYCDIIDRAPMIFKREAYEYIGGIDRSLLVGGYNDWDLCLRWRAKGYRVGLYDTQGYHFRYWDAGSLRSGSKITSHHGYNREKVILKNYDHIRTSGLY